MKIHHHARISLALLGYRVRDFFRGDYQDDHNAGSNRVLRLHRPSSEESPMKITTRESLAALYGLLLLFTAAVVFYLAIGCGDNIGPAVLVPDAAVDAAQVHGSLLWADANVVLAEQYCAWEERCAPADVDFYFDGDVLLCAQFESEYLCVLEGYAECEGLYPERLIYYLDECAAKSPTSSCADGVQPIECRQAGPD